MDLSEFTANYAHLGDDELLCLWADRNMLVPDAFIALDSELQKRRLNKQNAIHVKKRFDALAAREAKGPLVNQVIAAKYERNVRHFVGWKEPEFSSQYGGRDIRTLFASIRHKYRVWESVPRPHGSLACLFNLVSFPVFVGRVGFHCIRFRLGRGTQVGQQLDYVRSCQLRFSADRCSTVGCAAD